MLRVEKGAGSSIELELWALSAAAFGNSSPRSRRRCRSDGASGGWPQCERFYRRTRDVDGARDISAFGGWRAFVMEKVAV